MSLRIAIAGGTGNVGGIIAKVLALKGHQIILGTRDPHSEKAGKALADVLAVGKVVASVQRDEDAVKDAQVVILAFPSQDSIDAVVKQAASLAGGIAGKVVIDATNPLTGWPKLELAPDFVAQQTSSGEVFQRALPGAKVYKALNSIGALHFGKPVFGGKVADGLFAGPSEAEDAEGYRLVTRVLTDCGFHPRYVGPLRYSRNLESMAELWVHMAYVTKAHGGDNKFAFTVIDEGAAADGSAAAGAGGGKA